MLGWVAVAAAVPGDRETVHAEGVGDQVEMLPFVTDRVRPSQPEGVVEGAVDGLGVVAPPVQLCEVGVRGWDLADVLGPVEPASRVVAGGVEPDGDGVATESVGEPVDVVPAVGAGFVGVAVGTDPLQLVEAHGAGGVELADPDRPAVRSVFSPRIGLNLARSRP